MLNAGDTVIRNPAPSIQCDTVSCTQTRDGFFCFTRRHHGIRWADMQKREPTCRVGGPRCKKGRPSVRPMFRVGGPRCKKGRLSVRPMFRVGGPRCKKGRLSGGRCLGSAVRGKSRSRVERPHILAENRALAWSVRAFSPKTALSRRASSHPRLKSRFRVELSVRGPNR